MTETIKELTIAHDLAELTDFVDSNETSFYLSETNYTVEEIDFITNKYDGNSLSRIEENTMIELKEYFKNKQ